MTRLAGKVALLTGAGSGIARASARLFAREGAKVALLELDNDRGTAAGREIAEAGGEALFVPTDVTQEEQVAAAVAATVERFGKLDTVLNCAGGSVVEDDVATKVDMSVWPRTMNLDVLGTFLVCRHAIPEIAKAGGGSVVNMSSGAALRGANPAHVYTAAKGAILSLTRGLAGQFARDRVRVNAICAGRILTERNLSRYGRPGEAGPLDDPQDAEGRLKEYPFWVGEPDDIAAIALFLASDESKMITGAAIPADGGRSAY
jgi:NAD(P)-dependent dehydrogenase (short-subunit alcohol dehydrogenase family)